MQTSHFHTENSVQTQQKEATYNTHSTLSPYLPNNTIHKCHVLLLQCATPVVQGTMPSHVVSIVTRHAHQGTRQPNRYSTSTYKSKFKAEAVVN